MEEPQPTSPADLSPLGAEPLTAPPAAPTHAKSLLHSIFIGPQGLRAGWRFLIYIVLVAVLGVLLLGWIALVKHPGPQLKLWLSLLGEVAQFLVVCLATYIMSRFEKRRFGQYGLPGGGAFGSMFWVGAVWGFFWLTVLLLVMRAMGAFYFGHLAIHGIRILKFGAFYALVFLFVGLFEESLLRGYAQYTLTTGIGFWPAAVLLSASFGALHAGNSGEAFVGLLAAALIGLFFCLTLRRTGSLWFAVGFHMSWDWGESFFYSTPDSGQMSPGHLLNSSFQGSRWITGGTVGPEGSVLVLALIVVMWVVFDRMYRQARYPDLTRGSARTPLPSRTALVEPPPA